MTFLLETLRLGLTNLLLHKLRSFLTALGIIFGVAAVIVMVAIGEGIKEKALDQIRQLGARNIIVRSIKPPKSSDAGESQNFVFSYGMFRKDLRRIEQTVQPIERVVPLKRVGSNVTRGKLQAPAIVFGTTPNLQEVASLKMARGRYLNEVDLEQTANVCVIGSEIAKRLFPLADPIGSKIKVGNYRNTQLFKVVGVLQPIGLAGGAGSALVGRDLNFDMHIPLSSANARFGDLVIDYDAGSRSAEQVELSELYIQVSHEDHVVSVASQIQLLLDYEHKEKGDVTMIVPLELLAQKKNTLRMLNALLVSIASISLLVGGIGIMNIMLASVTERTREIGIRRALGATQRHIVSQFLTETTILSGLGGIVGVTLGLLGALLIGLLEKNFPGIERPIVTLWSIVASFFVATLVGIVFGLYPAVKASRQDPIVALRHD